MGADVLLFNTLVVGLSITGGVLGTLQVVRRGTTEGLSLTSQVGLLFSCCSWAVFGFLQADLPQVIANGVGVAAIVPVLIVGRVCGRLDVRRTAPFAFAFVALLGAGVALLGANFAGLVASVFTVANKVPQLSETWKAPGGAGVSIPSNLFGVSGAGMWLVYGLAHGATLVVLTSAYCAAVGLFVAARTARGTQGAGRAAFGRGPLRF